MAIKGGEGDQGDGEIFGDERDAAVKLLRKHHLHTESDPLPLDQMVVYIIAREGK